MIEVREKVDQLELIVSASLHDKITENLLTFVSELERLWSFHVHRTNCR